VLFTAGLSSCVPVDGGAIELSWIEYCAAGQRPDSNGASCSCNARAAGLSRVRLAVMGVGDGAVAAACEGRSGCEFDAARQSGTTGFFIPPGDYDISLVPLGPSDTPLGGPECAVAGATGCWATPPPVRRMVVKGQVVSLGSFEIAVPDCPIIATCDGGCAGAP
jgi:hypothetical protein